MGLRAQCTAGTEQEASATGPDLPRPGPEEDFGGLEAWGLAGRGGGTEIGGHWELQQMPQRAALLAWIIPK